MTADRGGPATRLGSRLTAALGARQLIVRANGRTRFVQLSGATQVALALCLLGAVAMGAAAGFGLWRAAMTALASREHAIADAQLAQRNLLLELAEHQHAMGAIARDLHEKQRVLRELFEENENLKTGLVSTEERLKITEAERQRIADGRVAIRRQMSRLEAEMQNVAVENGALARHLDAVRGQLNALEVQNADLAALRAAQSRRIAALESQLGQAQQRAVQLTDEAATAYARLARAEQDRDAMATAGTHLRQRARDLEIRLAATDDLHRRTVQRYADQALASILEVEGLVGRTGLRLELLLPGLPAATPSPPPRRRGAQGGPFVPWREEPESPLDEATRTLAARVDRLDVLRDLLRALPLGEPVAAATVNSGFGYRRDPFSGRAAMHPGVDFSAAPGTPVYPTAAGTVAFAGWHAEYGRMIEIDHGYGIRTRYAHLSRSLVEPGRFVTAGQRIGLLGSTGRATGPHLHYEVMIQGKNVDPDKFMRARDVLQPK